MRDKNESSTGNRYDTGPTVALVVGDCRGAWNNGVFTGDSKLLRWVDLITTRPEPLKSGLDEPQRHIEVELFGSMFPLDRTTPLGAFAVMASYDPNRMLIIEAPDEVVDAVMLARGDLFDDSLDTE